MTTTFQVFLGRTPVGYLARSSEGRIGFRFAEPYLAMRSRPVLGQFFEDNLGRVSYGTRGGLPPFFANLIPEPGPLRNLLEKTLGVPSGDDLAFLEAVGSDLPGAVRIVPTDDWREPDEMAVAVDDDEPRHTDDDPAAGLRFSLAGVQMKFSVLRESKRITLPAHNQHGDWIVKIGSVHFPHVVENEYATMEWARAAGFDVPECHIQDVESMADALRRYVHSGAKVFVIRRYDRVGRRRIHQEDLAQVAGLRPELKYGQLKYEQCAALVAAIVDEAAYYEFVRRLVFTIASGNADAHLKNWSLVYPDGIRAVLAPMYDQVSTIAWPDVRSELALKMVGTKNWFQIDTGHFARLAGKAGKDIEATVSTVQATLERLVAAWNDSSVREVLPASHCEALQDFWSRVPLLRPFSGGMR